MYNIQEFKIKYAELFIEIIKSTLEEEEPTESITLEDGSRLYIDADVFIYYIARGEVASEYYMTYETDTYKFQSYSRNETPKILFKNCECVLEPEQYMGQIIVKMEVYLDELKEKKELESKELK